MSISVFSIVKNEAQFIGYGVMSLLPYVDEIVYADGDSTDGTLELLSHIQEKYAGNKLKVMTGMDCKDFKSDYVNLFNEVMGSCKGDYLWYNHPDMILTNPGSLVNGDSLKELAYYVNMRSFGGDDMEFEIVKGRTSKWKTIMKNTLGLKYWGPYGHDDEDMYFEDITGNEHKVYQDMSKYPYRVGNSGIDLWHFCECKPRKRREEKMITVLKTNVPQIFRHGPTMGNDVHLFDMIANHPRVSLQTANNIYGNFEFKNREDALPAVFNLHKAEFDAVLGNRTSNHKVSKITPQVV